MYQMRHVAHLSDWARDTCIRWGMWHIYQMEHVTHVSDEARAKYFFVNKIKRSFIPKWVELFFQTHTWWRLQYAWYYFPGPVFSINEASHNFSSIRCFKSPESTVKDDGYCIVPSVVKGRIGYNLKFGFLEVIEVCYDILRHITAHTKHTLHRNVVSNESEMDRKNYILLEFFETPDQFYTCENQIASLGHFLHSETLAKRFISCDNGSDMYLTKAHLVPRNDFLYQFQRKTTSYDVNTAPQWQTINSGNWRILENRIRRYANTNNVDLTIVTGTLNVTTLPNLSDVQKHLYLTKGRNTNITLPLPALFWKLVHDRTSNSGIVFLLVNSPYHNNPVKSGFVVCDCICSKTTSWFDGWNRFDTRRGYVYCCTVRDFKLKTGINPYPFWIKNILL